METEQTKHHVMRKLTFLQVIIKQARKVPLYRA